jgi:hypothetical protein
MNNILQRRHNWDPGDTWVGSSYAKKVDDAAVGQRLKDLAVDVHWAHIVAAKI